MKGISLLEVKNHMLLRYVCAITCLSVKLFTRVPLPQHKPHMLSYVINLTQLMLMKVEGHSIIGCGPVRRLVEIRTVRLML